MATKSKKTPNIDSLSFAELQTLNDATQQRMKDVREDERLKLRTEFEAQAAENGFSLAEVVGVAKLPKSRRKAAQSVAKYANPDDPTQTFVGRGRKPKWMVEKLDSGVTMEDMLIS